MSQINGLFRVGRDAELRSTPNGDKVLNLALAYNYGRKGDDGKKPTQWIEATLWGKLAEALAPYIGKGTQVYATIGDPHIETYQGANGPGYKLVGKIQEIELASGGKAPEAKPVQKAVVPPTSRSINDMDNDIPW